MRTARFALVLSLTVLACLVPPAARAASLGVGTVSVSFNLVTQKWSGLLTFDGLDHDLFGKMVNLGTEVGPLDIKDGDLDSFDVTMGGTFTVVMASQMAGKLSFDASGSFLCGTAGCISPGPHSLVGAVDALMGTFAATLPPNVTYTGDLSISCTVGLGVLTCNGPIGINAFQSVPTLEGQNSIVQQVVTYYNSKSAKDLTLPITITYAGVGAPGGITLVTASSANGGTLPPGYTLTAQGFDPTFLEVSTDAPFTPPITLCVDYADADGDGFIDGTGVSLDNLRVLHGESGVFNDVTITASIGTTQACAQVDSLSPFVVALAPTTTTTTLPVCTPNTVCPDDGDPCTTESCVTGTGCRSASVLGLAGASCVCRRGPVASCVGQPVPGSVNGQVKAACKAIAKAETNKGNAKKLKKFLKAAARSFKKAKALAAKAGKKKKGKVISGPCATALGDSLTDAGQRTDRAITTP